MSLDSISEEKPVLLKCIKSESLLPGESQEIQLIGKRFEDGDVVEVEPRIEGPRDFPKHHLQTVKDNSIVITNDSVETIKIKKHMPLCQVLMTREALKNSCSSETKILVILLK